MATLLVQKMSTNYNSSLLTTGHSKPILLCVFPTLVSPSTLSFNGAFSVNYCLYINALCVIQPPTHFRYIYIYTHTQVRPSDEPVMNYVALLWVEVGQPCSTT